MSTYIHFTEEQKQRAASVDLEEFLRCRAKSSLPPAERNGWPVTIASPSAATSGTIMPRSGGGHAVSFVQRVLSPQLSGGGDHASGRRAGNGLSLCEERVEEPPKPFVLPPANSNMRRVYAYLVKHRNIDRSVVAHFAREKLLYETPITTMRFSWVRMKTASPAMPTSAAPTASAKPSGSMWRAAIPATASTTSAQMGASMCSKLPSICSPTSRSIRRAGRATAMWPAAAPAMNPVRWILTRMEAPQMVSLCLDHDNAGDQGCERMAKQISSEFGIPTRRLVPEQKDWNEDLCALREAPRRQRMEMEMR